MPGPAPNPNAIRRNARVGMVRLPAEGRKGRTPKWPLPDNPTLVAAVRMEEKLVNELEERELDGDLSSAEMSRLTRARRRLAIAEETLRVVKATEAEIWRDLWHTPQAVEWERLRWNREVAQYVRWKALGETGNRAAGAESRAYADALGLTPKSMRALMWTIAPDEVTAERVARKADSKATELRRKFRAVEELEDFSGQV